MATLILITVQVLGAISLYYWFFANSQFFYLINKHRKANPFLLFTFPLGFITFPGLLALSYKLAWDYFDESAFFEAFGLSIFPAIIFIIGVYIFKKIQLLD
ncbi:hypothetical protein EGI22_13405 [Lacihabitans sp. LS3-19]|uniref:hypothetical protein n=1 Tax=Lacihabitans sp. LS3-19 TaxID=2487335 RepID=UPI0020CD98B5|nr:hypothetical protein [Lacihabitans sp. LS3-19]MCP9768910.1 hypothetical protein [Lacihabitans sp. LS3-19]